MLFSLHALSFVKVGRWRGTLSMGGVLTCKEQQGPFPRDQALCDSTKPSEPLILTSQQDEGLVYGQ